MRQLGLVADERAAQRFADYLLTQGIPVSLEPDRDGCRIWVRNEDHLEAARRQFAQFNAAPDAAIYQQAGHLAEQMRAEERKRAQDARKNVIDVRTRWRGAIGRRCPVTILLLAASIAVAIFTKLGADKLVVMHFTIDEYRFIQRGDEVWIQLKGAWRTQPWRVITPIFVHFGIWHLLFNMLMLLQLGAIVEAARGSWRFLVFVLVIAIPSNIAQFLWTVNPNFGGMSGVLYGLFGYVWMKSRYEPSSGFYITPNTVLWMVGWFFLCLFGVMGNVANVVHGVGFVVGIIVGRWPSLWRSLRR
jgi:GlpG protein